MRHSRCLTDVARYADDIPCLAFADNSIGDAVCKFGSCRIACPAGYALRTDSSPTKPYYCYNGEGSLVH